MSPDTVVNLGILAYFLGLLATVLIPYTIKYFETGEAFDYHYAVPRVIGLALVGIGAIVSPGFIDWLVNSAAGYEYTALYFLFVFITTYGGGAVSRDAQKFGSAVYAKMSAG